MVIVVITLWTQLPAPHINQSIVQKFAKLSFCFCSVSLRSYQPRMSITSETNMRKPRAHMVQKYDEPREGLFAGRKLVLITVWTVALLHITQAECLWVWASPSPWSHITLQPYVQPGAVHHSKETAPGLGDNRCLLGDTICYQANRPGKMGGLGGNVPATGPAVSSWPKPCPVSLRQAIQFMYHNYVT